MLCSSPFLSRWRENTSQKREMGKATRSSGPAAQRTFKLVLVALLAALLIGRVAAETTASTAQLQVGELDSLTATTEDAANAAPALDAHLAAGGEPRPLERQTRYYCPAGQVS